VHDPRELDALLEDRGGGWWSAFFADRARDSANPCPFLVDWPDESLVSWFSQGLLAPRARAGTGLRKWPERGPYGQPGMHRRCRRLLGTRRRVDAAASEIGRGRGDRPVLLGRQRLHRPAGVRASLGGGLGYSESGLRAMWDLAPFRVRELRQMRETDIKDQCFGQGFI
jgi:hypothetical protein